MLNPITYKKITNNINSVQIMTTDIGNNLTNISKELENLRISLKHANNKFDHYLHFYEHRAFEGVEPPNPEGLVEFTSAHYSYSDLLHYKYVSFKTMAYYINVRKDHLLINQYITTLSDEEIDVIFDKYNVNGKINLGILQKADIEKINQELRDEELIMGIEIGSDGIPILNEDKKPISNISTGDYQTGMTIVIPIQYALSPDYNRMRFNFNFNTLAVREYCIRVILRTLNICKDNAIFIDNVFISSMQLYNDSPFNTESLNYISGGNILQQSALYAKQYLEIIEAAFNRSKEDPLIITNGWLDSADKTYRDAFTDVVRVNLDDFDGIMSENDFLRDNHAINVQWFIDGIKEFKAVNTKAIFAIAYSAMSGLDDPFIYRAWLWLHLVADTNVFAYINDRYNEPMKDLDVFSYPLGSPLEEAHQEGEVWQRKYQRGTIYFDVSNKKLEDIYFVEE